MKDLKQRTIRGGLPRSAPEEPFPGPNGFADDLGPAPGPQRFWSGGYGDRSDGYFQLLQGLRAVGGAGAADDRHQRLPVDS